MILRSLHFCFICLLAAIVCWSIAPSGVAQDSGAQDSGAQDTGGEDPVPPSTSVDFASAQLTAEGWIPETALAFARIAPASSWLDHPFRNWLVQTEPFKKVWRSPEVMKVRGGITVGEFTLGMKLEVLLRRLTAGGAYAAIDRETEGVVVLVRADDEQWLKKTFEKVVDIVRKDAESKGQSSPLQSADYKGVRGYEIQKGIFAVMGPWLMVTNKGDLAKAVIDRKLDPSLQSLKDVTWRTLTAEPPQEFVDSSGVASSGVARLVAADLDLEQARETFAGNDLFRKQANDFGAELILGGILSLLQNAPSASMTLDMEPTALNAQFAVPTEMEWFRDSREHYVGPEGAGRALPPIELEGSIAALSTYRNVSEMWLRAGDLFDQNVNDQLAQADNTLTTLFSGKDFGEDILGAMEPELRMITIPQTFADERFAPAVKLPAFALVAKLKQPEAMRRELKRIFQSFIGFLNVVGAMEGNPQLDLSTENQGSNPIHWAEYIADEDRKYENGYPIQFNFSPAVAFSGDYAIVASTVELARRLAACDLNASTESKLGTQQANTLLEVNVQGVRDALELNRSVMIAQNMLEKGHSRLEATKEIEMLMSILELIGRARVDLTFSERSTLQLRVDYLQP